MRLVNPNNKLQQKWSGWGICSRFLRSDLVAVWQLWLELEQVGEVYYLHSCLYTETKLTIPSMECKCPAQTEIMAMHFCENSRFVEDTDTNLV